MDNKHIVADDDWLLPDVALDDEDHITPAMLRAGVAALANWNYDDEEPEVGVAAIWYAMCRAKKLPALPE